MKLYRFKILMALALTSMMWMSSACSMLEPDESEEDAAIYLLSGVWFDEFEGRFFDTDVSDSLSFYAQNTVELSDAGYFIESYVYADYDDDANGEPESVYFFDGTMQINAVTENNDNGGVGVVSFGSATLDTSSIGGPFVAIDQYACENASVNYTVEYEALDTIIVEEYEGDSGTAYDSIHVTGIGYLTLDVWYDAPEVTQYFTVLIEDNDAEKTLERSSDNRRVRPLFTSKQYHQAGPNAKASMHKLTEKIISVAGKSSVPKTKVFSTSKQIKKK